MMLCIVINGPTFEDAHQQISKALEYADLVELRLDCFAKLDLAELRNLRSKFSIPMIFALRSSSQGGYYIQSEQNRLVDIRHLMTLQPEYFDLEMHVDSCFIEEISSQYPGIKLILSYHNFEETPEDLEGIYREMQKIPAFFYKFAVMPQNCLDTMRLMQWKKMSDDKLIAICMGSHGQVSRILGPILGSPITYAALEDNQQTAPGQLSARTLIDQYHYHSLSPQTTLYGLIGNPIVNSISDETHNDLIKVCGIDAVYIKIQVTPSELANFLQFAKQLSFRGLSVTMPLKEHILAFLDYTDPFALEIGAVNTLLFEDGKICGFNTDGIGALNAIEKECFVKEKRIVIIGTGGATKAIAYEALRRGGVVTIVNRNAEKALHIAEQLHCTGIGLESMANCVEIGYDILINCTPSDLPIAPNYIIPQTIVMDITIKPKETGFLKHAKQKKCRIICGYNMFVEQAIGQFNLWFTDHSDEYRIILENKALACLGA